MADANKIVVLAGATGNLGSLIAQALLEKPEVKLRVLVRPESVAKVSAFIERGAEVVEVDLSGQGQGERLEEAMKDAYAVVSALQGGPNIMVDAQLRLLRSARRADVRRFIPSCFSYNIFGLDAGDNINTDMLRAFASASEGERGHVDVVHIQNGAFLDRKILFGFLGAFDLDHGRAFLWGDGNAEMDFTTYADTARYTAEVAVDEGTVPSIMEVAGDTLDFHELVRAYERGSGKSVAVDKKGTLSDLDDEIQRRKEEEPENMFAWLPFMYWRAMLSGKGKLHSIANDRYPHIKATTVVEYVRNEAL